MAKLAPTARLSQAWSLTPSKNASDTGLDAEQFLKKVVGACAANVAVFDESGALLYVSAAWQAFARQNGFTTARDGYGLFRLRLSNHSGRPANKRTGFRDCVQQIIKEKKVEFQGEYILKLVPTSRWFVTRAAFVDVPRGFRMLVTLEDVTRRHEAEEELRNIGGRLINAQEEERTRLGRELHDDLSQRLALLSLELEQLRPQIPSDRSALDDSVRRLSKSTQELCSDVHRLSYQLHPFKLDQLGLCAAIDSMCAEISLHQQIAITFHHQGFSSGLPADVTLCVFRIVQESLHNIVKHSSASAAQVVLTKTRSALRLRVSDNGCGFNVAVAKKKNRLGLVSIKERLRLVGGEILVRSKPNHGTQIHVLIPLTHCEAGTNNQFHFMSDQVVRNDLPKISEEI
jgi:signal transduction histidine kinase